MKTGSGPDIVPDPQVRLLAITALAKAVYDERLSCRYLNEFVKALGHDPQSHFSVVLNDMLIAVQIWTDTVCQGLPRPTDAVGVSFMTQSACEGHTHPSFDWATRVMTARYNDDRDMFEGLVGSLLLEDSLEPITEGISSVLYLCAHMLRRGPVFTHEYVDATAPDSPEGL